MSDNKPEENSSPINEKQTKESLNLTPETPIQIDDFTLGDILDSDTVKMIVKSVLSLFEQSSQNDKGRNEITRIQLQNQVELKRLNIKEREMDIASNGSYQKHISRFDIRNKVFSILMLGFVIFAVVVLKQYDILGKDEAKTVVIIALTVGMTGNIDFIKNVFKKKPED